jgi:hypothetical protein
MKVSVACIAVVACLSSGLRQAAADTPSPAPTAAPADLVQQVQAADLLADLITYTVDRADVRLNQAMTYLQSIGKTDAFNQAKPNAPTPRPLNYMLLFRGSLAFVEGDGKKYADPSVANQPTSQLYEDLTAAQYYNMHEFLHYNQQRQAFASVRAYLESINEYQKYLASTGGETAAARPPTTGPAPATPDQVATRLGDMLNFIYETSWKQAQAKGTSQADFEKNWPEQVRQYRESVMEKIEGSQPSEAAFGKSQLAGSTPPPPDLPAPAPLPAHYDTPAPADVTASQSLPAPVQSPYSNANYRAKDTSLWNMWDYDPRF